MNISLTCDKLSFTLSKSAQEHLQKILPGYEEGMSKRKLVPTLSYAGAGRKEKDGKVIWEYKGPLFLLAGQKCEAPRDGKYYDVLGFPVWIGETDNLLLKGRVLTFMRVGSPEPEDQLVIENAPENYFEMALRDNRTSCCEPKIKRSAGNRSRQPPSPLPPSSRAAGLRRTGQFDRTMKSEHHHSKLSPPPAAVAALCR